MAQIIGVVGFINSGKDTVADYLTTFEEYRRESFAASLKDAVSAVFGWNRILLEGKTAESRAWREKVDSNWAARLGIPDLTPRLMLQLWGTEVCRNGFHDDIWIASLENRIRNSSDNIVITDCRFPNEIDAVKAAGGKIVWVRRGELPDWYQSGVDAANGNTIGYNAMKIRNIHSSEWKWLSSDFDAIIDNNGTIDDLHTKIKEVISI